MMKIDKGIPIPTPECGRKGIKWKALAEALEVGDSLFLEGGNNNMAQSRAALMRRYNPALKFTTRKVDGGVRIWRTA